MTERKYFVSPNTADFREKNKYYRECQKREVPYIVVITKRKYATVDWDHNSLPIATDEKLRANIDEIRQQIFAAFRRCCGPKSELMTDAWTGYAERLEPHAAESLATEVFDILTAHLAA